MSIARTMAGFTQDRRGRGSYEMLPPPVDDQRDNVINGLAYGSAAVLAPSLDMWVGYEGSRSRFPRPLTSSTALGRRRIRSAGRFAKEPLLTAPVV
ncbi:MAG TPA: hypothetical protein VE687_20160 [Stellaceae bacterium]|nr:hypothetical protein [Stellaceae bacterium]